MDYHQTLSCFFKTEILKGKVPLAAVTSDRLATAGDVPIMAVHWLSSVSKSKALPILDWTFWNKPSELPGYIGIKKSSRCFIDQEQMTI